jgi:hypothetical protein
MTTKRKSKHPVITHGLYARLDELRLDGRTKVVQAMQAAREGLSVLFPQGVNAPAAIVIDRIVFKALKLSLYEASDLSGEAVTAGGEQRYITMSNSLREDLRLLSALAEKKPPEAGVPSLSEYLEALKAKVQVIEAVPATGRGD